MIAGVTLNIFNNHADRVRMANLAQTINVLQAVVLTNKEKIVLTPTYHVMEMYNVHQDATLIPVSMHSADYISGTDTLPAVSASASKDKKGVIHISIVNIDLHQKQSVNLNLAGISATSISGRILVSSNISDHNSFDEPEKIRPAVFNGAVVKSGSVQLSLPPASVVVLELK